VPFYFLACRLWLELLVAGLLMFTCHDDAYRSATSKLTMENVPWHSDVKEFSEVLASKSGGVYEVACEHAHSCCVLLAKVDKFKINGKWHTWIDYDRFHELVSFLNN
jgi:wyosine [tRNA(Phe)-imidazoG37] synthetase (radical SAM superfamily)